ncbi:hypothetical protein CDAR_40231 [Caerostris darwini]|uniref:Uncharacterized protein n=1 Tax=Caerostris darwini TaxID=1538125 RepID=A0AAV4RBX5_9ARAC|nr:hypothetical protein CDAR_40231 [Caerostris darwini]
MQFHGYLNACVAFYPAWQSVRESNNKSRDAAASSSVTVRRIVKCFAVLERNVEWILKEAVRRGEEKGEGPRGKSERVGGKRTRRIFGLQRNSTNSNAWFVRNYWKWKAGQTVLTTPGRNMGSEKFKQGVLFPWQPPPLPLPRINAILSFLSWNLFIAVARKFNDLWKGISIGYFRPEGRAIAQYQVGLKRSPHTFVDNPLGSCFIRGFSLWLDVLRLILECAEPSFTIP